MKQLRVIFITGAAVFFWGQVSSRTQTNNTTGAVDSQLQAAVQSVQSKLKIGKNTEADLSDEFKLLDRLLARHANEAPDEMAQILYMKAMLYLQVLTNLDKGKELINQIKHDYPETRLGQNADRILESLDKRAEAQKIKAALSAGLRFPDFNEQDLNGKPLSVGGFKGKVVLVEFWATWCGPCRAELPNIIATYKKYHDRGFEIIGVSLDSDRDKLESFLKKQKMTWPQYFDCLGWENKLAGKYGVESIPFTILIGPDGKIIGTDLRGEKLESAVAAALGIK
jgi:thiol-disulfide isomerase/thioredoxin